MKPLLLLVLLSSCSLLQRGTPLKVLHYNIKELDSTKLAKGDHPQMLALTSFLKPEQEANIISINELQFDRPQVPNRNYQSYGLNLEKLTNLLWPKENWSTSFSQANTGNKARKWKGQYLIPGQTHARKNADPVNFGLFPGQYSTGLATTYEIIGKIVVTDLKWRDFNPGVKLNHFRDATGSRLPKDIALFDKNFTDTLIKVRGQVVHLITLHTVPAFHFGNAKSPNYQRNADQLRFLQWYLTGRTDFKVELPARFDHVRPLSPHDTFIAMGDWNTELDHPKNPGSKILRSFDATGRLFPSLGDIKADKEKVITNEGYGHNPKRLKMVLDYLYWSSDLEPKLLKVLRPPEERLFLGCGEKTLITKDQDNPTRERVSYQQGREKCQMTVSKSFVQAKKASDHFPLKAHFDFR